MTLVDAAWLASRGYIVEIDGDNMTCTATAPNGYQAVYSLIGLIADWFDR